MAIATAGGTIPIQIDDTTGDTKEQLLSALQGIQNVTFACDMPIPSPTGAVDYENVNVAYVLPDGTEQRFLFNETCNGGEGWRYDITYTGIPGDPLPTKIELCPATCAALQGDMSGDLNVLFGCARWVI